MLSLSDTNPKFLQSWLRLQYLIKTGTLSATRVAHTVFVDGTFGSAAGARENPAKPFKTVQQGVNAALAGDVVLIAPGIYTENVVMAPTSGVVLGAECPNSVFITGVAGVDSPVIDYVGAVPVQRWELSNLVVIGVAAAAPTIRVDLTGTNTGFAGSALRFDHVGVVSGAGVRTVDLTLVNHVQISESVLSGPVYFSNCGSEEIVDCDLDSISVTYDAAIPQPIAGRSACEVRNCKLANPILVNQQASLAVGSSQLDGVTAVLNDNGVLAGSVTVDNSSSTGIMSISASYATTSGICAKIQTSKLAGLLAFGVGSPNTIIVFAQGCVFDVGSIVANNAELNILGSVYKDSQLTAIGTGVIDRSIIRYTGLVTGVPGVVAFAPALPPLSAGAQYSSVFTPLNIAPPGSSVLVSPGGTPVGPTAQGIEIIAGIPTPSPGGVACEITILVQQS